MIFKIYGRAFKALIKQPFRLIGLSLFGILLITLGCTLFSMPIGLGVAIALLFDAALAQIFLRSYRGETCTTKDVFAPFKDLSIFKRTLGGMAWRELWLLIWGIIPIVGWVFAIIRYYQYALTPYILLNEEDVKPMDVLEESRKRTKGYVGKMFLADLLLCGIILTTLLILVLFCRIPYIQYLFYLVLFLFVIACFALLPLFVGLVHAAFYEEIMNPTLPLEQPAPQQPYQQPYQQPAPQQYAAPAAPEAQPAFRFCTSCGTRFDANQARFCPNCGKPAD